MVHVLSRADWRSTPAFHQGPDDGASSSEAELALPFPPVCLGSPPFPSPCSAAPHGSGPWINILPRNRTIHYPPDN